MYQEKRKDYGPRRNEYIRVPQVQLIGSKGENIGVVDTAKALSLAKEVGLDLVEVGAGINPPVCKIMDYSKYIYIQNKKTRQNKKGKLKETKETLRHEFGVSDSEQMWVLPSRLIKIKGIVPFLKALVGLNGYRLFILGDGEQHHEIQNLVDLNKLNVDLIGFLQQNELIRYYAAADLFVLPSFEDPSPLSPIEAIAAGLPILVSQNIGNIDDVLEDGVNGLKFEPGNVPMINKLAKEVLRLNRNELEIRGIASRKQYLHFFETENCLRNYAQQIQDAIKND